MKKPHGLIVAAALLASTALAAAQAPAELPVDKLAARAISALARLEYKYLSDLTGKQTRYGLCICIDAKRGTFMTGDLGTGVLPKEVEDFVLVRPDEPGKKVKAKLLGMDREEGLTFLTATEPHGWSELKLSSSTGLKLGQRVVSVGLLEPGVGSPPYVGIAHVSAMLRLPDEYVTVSGGTLTCRSSPVMTTDGRIIGLVRGQIGYATQMLLRGRWGDVRMRDLQNTRGFVPTAEFAHVIANIPTLAQPRRLPWIGALSYEPLTEMEAAARDNLRGRTAAVVGRVVPDSPAARAGVEQGDLIVGLNGKPLEKLPTPALVASSVRRTMVRLAPGTKVRLTILRKDKEYQREVTLVERPPLPYEADRYFNAALGVGVRDLVKWDEYAAPSGTANKGLPVTAVRQNSPAHGKLYPNDRVVSINNKLVKSVAEARLILEPLAGGSQRIRFNVLRRGVEQEVFVNPRQAELPTGLPDG